jgi:hypothetical protein
VLPCSERGQQDYRSEVVMFVRGRSFSLYNAMIRRSPAYSRKKKREGNMMSHELNFLN